MIVLHTDLDNTLIYSHKREIGAERVCVEMYQGRAVSYMTRYSHDLLRRIHTQILVVPTTTRSVEQYERIDLGIERSEYALAANGGVLLVDGRPDEEWYRISAEMAEESREELLRGEKILEDDETRCLEVRNIHGLFLFTKCSDPVRSVERLKRSLDPEKVDVFNNGIKVYLMPRRIDKGTAVKRLRKKLGLGTVIAAGDSEFDLPMLWSADVALMPEELRVKAGCPKKGEINVGIAGWEALAWTQGAVEHPCAMSQTGEGVFSDRMLERAVEIAEASNTFGEYGI